MIGAAVLMQAAAASVQGDGIRLEFDGQMRTRVVATGDRDEALGPFSESESLLTAQGSLGVFALDGRATQPVTDALGDGQRTVLTGRAGGLTKEVEVTAYAGRPRWLFLRVRYRNEGTGPIQVDGYASQRYEFEPGQFRGEPAFWSYQGASYESRPDWVLPLGPGFRRANYLGMNDSDYGGGTPVVDVWRRDIGLAIGHVELVPKLVSLPVERLAGGRASVALTARRPVTLAAGGVLETVRTFVAVHRGDYFITLREYAAVMQAQGIEITSAPKDAFDPIWCAWGYGRTFT